MIRIQVFDPQGKKNEVDVDPNSTINDVKAKVAAGFNFDEDTIKFTIHGDRDVFLEPMKIYIRNFKGQKFLLNNVDPLDTINDIKKKLEAQENIPADEQYLLFGETPLNDEMKTLNDHKIRHRAWLDLEPMTINIKTTKGDVFDLTVDPTDAIAEIKKKILDTKNIPLYEQILSFKGKSLTDDSKTLAESGIRHRDTLKMEKIKVHVKDGTIQGKGKIYTFEFEPVDKIDDIKNAIADALGIPPKQQLLSFKKEMLVENRKTLRGCNIKHESTLNLEQMKIKIKTFQGDKFMIVAEQTDNLHIIKERVLEKKDIPLKDQILYFDDIRLDDLDMTLADCGIQHLDKLTIEEHMKVLVQDDTKTGNGKVYTLRTEETLAILEVVQMIADEVGIPKNKQLLSFGKTIILEKDMGTTLRDYGIKHKSTIHLVQMMINITTFQGDTFPLLVEPTDSLQSIMDRILEEKDIPLKDQLLIFNDKRLSNLHKTLADCGIKHESTVTVEEHMKVHVQDDTKEGSGKRYTLYTDEKYPISKITEMIGEVVGIPQKKQLLSFEESLILEKHMGTTLKDYGIKHNSTIHLVQMMITVKTFQGDSFMMTVDPMDKCRRIRQRVNKMKDIPINDQILVFKDKRLGDTNTLKDSGILHGDTVYINAAMKIFVQDDTRGSNGKIYTFYIEDTNTIHDISVLIQAKVGIEKDKQRMTFEGESLVEEDKTLKECGIKHESTIHVKKSYIPVDWKKTVEDRYGKVKVTTYDVDYSMEGDGFIKGIKDEKYQKVRLSGYRKSQMQDPIDS